MVELLVALTPRWSTRTQWKTDISYHIDFFWVWRASFLKTLRVGVGCWTEDMVDMIRYGNMGITYVLYIIFIIDLGMGHS